MNQIDVPLFKAQLLDELRSEISTPSVETDPVDVLDERRTPRHRSILLKAAAAAVVLAGVGAFTISRTDGSPTYALTQSANGIITVTWDDGFTDGEALAESLQDAGVDVDLQFLRGSPSVVGSLTAAYPVESGSLAPGITFDDNAMIIDTSLLEGGTAIDIAVASDEPYEVMGSAFDHDELLDGLACAAPTPLKVSDITPLLAGQDFDVVWNLNRVDSAATVNAPSTESGGDAFQPARLRSEFVEEPPPGIVMSALSSQPGTVMIDVLADGESVDAAQFFINMGYDPCTVERAARWTE